MLSFGTDGVRGRAGVELTADFALSLGRAAAQVLGADIRAAVIGGDTRESTAMLSAALASGLMSAGVDVVDLGVAPTPAVAFAAQTTPAIGAVISASHNPFGDNGIKLFAPGGRKLSDDEQDAIERLLVGDLTDDAPLAGASPSEEAGGPRFGSLLSASAGGGGSRTYAEHVVAALGGRSLAPLRVVVDHANGAAVGVAADVLRAAGAEVISIADHPDGRNINEGCGATHPALVAAAVVEHGADVGVALDGDADRLIAVDHTGAVVDGDHIIAICADDLRQQGRLPHDTVVVTVMTNLGFRLAMQERGITVVETPVGDRHVLEALAAGGFALGGEQSGHVVFAELATTGDGLLTALMLLDAVVRSGRPLHDLAAAAMTSLPQVLVNVRVEGDPTVLIAAASETIAATEATLGDAGRVLVRPSGTEPLVRVMVEASTAEQAAAAADAIADSLRSPH